MAQSGARNRFMPWIIGIIVIIAATGFVAYRMFAGDCPAPGFVEALVLIVVPLVYIALMYLTFKSQD